nr:hypothetical protein [Burkholderia seminalis]
MQNNDSSNLFDPNKSTTAGPDIDLSDEAWRLEFSWETTKAPLALFHKTRYILFMMPSILFREPPSNHSPHIQCARIAMPYRQEFRQKFHFSRNSIAEFTKRKTLPLRHGHIYLQSPPDFPSDRMAKIPPRTRYSLV